MPDTRKSTSSDTPMQAVGFCPAACIGPFTSIGGMTADRTG